MCEANFTEKQVDEALLAAFARVDAPQNASQRGEGVFRQGLTQEHSEGFRGRLLDLAGNDGITKLRDVAIKHFGVVGNLTSNSAIPQKSSVCVAGKRETGEQFKAMGFNVRVA